MDRNDLLIIGSGPAGMSAALNAKNDGLKFKLIESKEDGWFPRVSVDSHYTVDNYLGFSKVSGTEIISKFQDHLKNNGIVSLKEKVELINKNENSFRVQTNSDNYESDSLIIATGTKQKKLDAPGADRYLGKSVFYYCVPDGGKFIDKKVLVVGGRNTGAVTALYLNNMGCDVEVIERDAQINAKEKYSSKIMDAGIPFRVGTEIVSLAGGPSLKSAVLKTPKGLEEILVDGVFVCIGLEPNNDLAKQIGVDLDDWGNIKVDSHMATSVEGVYAAGDITGNLKQIVVAAAQGSIAAYNSSKYLRSKCKKE